MKDHGGHLFEISDDDMEALADEALGIERESPEERARANRTDRLRRLGLKLSARQAFASRRRRQFIRTLAETGIVSRAAAAAGWSSSAAYSLRAADEEFRKMWDNAMEFATDALEEEARRRGQFGVRKPIYQQGRLVGYQQEYSDPLLILLLKAHRRSVFGDQQKIDADVKGGVLVVPGVASDDAWSTAAAANQAAHRTNQGDADGDPLK